MPNALPSSRIDRFLTDLRTFPGLATKTRLGICVSGGPDSVALLLLTHAAELDFEVATVDHGLRTASAKEAAFVAQLCRNLSCAHTILTLTAQPHGNVSDWARRERYQALLNWADERGVELLMTAHHADDQLETMIMRLNRGSGVSGLSGIRRTNGRIIRPLLNWRKSELEAIVTEAGLQTVIDPSNQDERFDRARLRKSLQHLDWLDPITASRSAQALAEAEEALIWSTEAAFKEHVAHKPSGISLSPNGLPRELVRRLTLACLKHFNPQSAPRSTELEHLIVALTDSQSATLCGVKAVGGATWTFSKAPARRMPKSK